MFSIVASLTTAPLSNNTNDVVYSTANREFNIKSTIEKKRKKIENILKVNDIPKIQNYSFNFPP